MKTTCLLLLLLFLFPIENYSQSVQHDRDYEFPIQRKTNIHFNVANKNSFHYGSKVIANPFVTNFSARDQEAVEQSHFNTFDVSITINHFLKARQEVFGGIGFSEHVFEENGDVTYYISNNNIRTFPYSELYSYEHFYVVVGHRYTFPARGVFFPFIENSLQSDWLIDPPQFTFPTDYFKQNGYSYKFQFGYRSSDILLKYFKLKNFRINSLISVFFQSAIVKYNLKKFNRDYYPYAYGINLSMSFGRRKI